MVVDIQAPLTTPLTTHLTTHLTTPLATPPYYTPYVTPYYTPYATPYYTPYRTAFRRPPGPSLLLTLRASLPLTYSPTHLLTTYHLLHPGGRQPLDGPADPLPGRRRLRRRQPRCRRYGPLLLHLTLRPGRQITRPATLRALPRRAGALRNASLTYGCSLHRIRLQLASHTVAACLTCGCSLPRIRLQPASHTVAACLTYGCRRASRRTRSSSPPPTLRVPRGHRTSHPPR